MFSIRGKDELQPFAQVYFEAYDTMAISGIGEHYIYIYIYKKY